MDRQELAHAVRGTLGELVDAGVLAAPLPAAVDLRPPGPGGRGDWVSTVALELAGPAGMPPARLADLLAARLRDVEGVVQVVVTGAGFLNVSVTGGASDGVVAAVLAAGATYGMPEGGGEEALGPPPLGPPTPGPPTLGPPTLGPPPRWLASTGLPRTPDNPVFVVQLAHARLAALGGTADATGEGHVDAGLLPLLEELPHVVRRAVRSGDPEVLGRHLEVMAHRTLRWLDEPDGPPDADLAAATRLVLASGLRLLDVSTPARI